MGAQHNTRDFYINTTADNPFMKIQGPQKTERPQSLLSVAVDLTITAFHSFHKQDVGESLILQGPTITPGAVSDSSKQTRNKSTGITYCWCLS